MAQSQNGKKPIDWHQTHDQVLWACRTSLKEATNATPFRLTFGHDAILSIEVYLKSTRIQRQAKIPSEHYWKMMLDELVDLDEERLAELDMLIRKKQRVAKAYNKKVKAKAFAVNNCVGMVIFLPMDQKDKSLGKWSSNWEGPFQIIRLFTNNAYKIEELSSDCRILRVNGKYLKRDLIQNAIRDGRLKFVDKGKNNMKVDADPLNVADTNHVEPVDINMVDVSEDDITSGRWFQHESKLLKAKVTI
ncbi:uncharacterized protein LOC131642871 [Vicia villosa]|uniref:uncharacterized protein LOC131642871 n=1 Tax=Vicia villosa TaxID=3911 RepID=UPI00273CCB47|nr:uncharacterized protein LOC131642871 [Vicia villosa]